MKLISSKVFIFIFLLSFFNSCATYYQKQSAFNQDFAAGNIEAALRFLEKNKEAAEKKDRLLYFLDRGVVEQMLGNYQQSNYYFEQAYIFSQDYRKSFSQDLIGMTANPMMMTYKGEDYEIVLLHFYKAINFLQLNDLEAALVEVRRINIRLNELNDQYENRKNRYKKDAFAHTLMGLIYEAKGNYNDAFIAYRNALETYRGIYGEEFGLKTPEQLKKDILKMAAYNNFTSDLNRYEEEFQMKYQKEEDVRGQLVYFWLNGLGPVKSEFSINLSILKGKGGAITFANEQEQISLPYTTQENYYNADPAEFSDLKFVRMAIPKFKVRKPLAESLELRVNEATYYFEKVEDVEKVAISVLQDRVWREIAKSIGRLAVKQAAEKAADAESENLGTVVSMLGAFTEKADTRNWQSLPHSIYYQKVPLSPGKHEIQLISRYPDATDTSKQVISIGKNQTIFKTFHTLASTPPQEQ